MSSTEVIVIASTFMIINWLIKLTIRIYLACFGITYFSSFIGFHADIGSK